MTNRQDVFSVSGMHCGGCVAKVQRTLVPFADEVSVTLEPPRATFRQLHAPLAELNQALAATGSYQLTALAEAVPVQIARKTSTPKPAEEANSGWFSTYRPLLLIVAYILLTNLLIELASGEFHAHRWMPHFMAGFFLVFSFFKLLNLRDFASSYAMYDLLAMRLPAYGVLYPFIELALGIAYLLNWQPQWTNLATLVVMGFSSLGVIRAVASRQKIRCACLGAVFNLPMSTVTIIEDLLMVAMAGYMLL